MSFSIKLYRKRFIPNETIYLKDDRILSVTDSLILTSWDVLKPRPDFASGISAYYRKEGFKISRIADKDGNLCYWYCDIMEEQGESPELVFVDLLIDIIVYPDGCLRVMDLDEAADAREQGLITDEQLFRSMRTANRLLTDVYHGRFDALTECIRALL